MKRDVVSTNKAPAAVGPYSQAAVYNRMVYCSGQLPIDPATGKAAGDTIEELTRQCLKNLNAVLEAAGSSLRNVIKVNIYLTDMKDFPAVNRIYGEFFEEPYPARACIQAAALPLGMPIEIEAVGAVAE